MSGKIIVAMVVLALAAVGVVGLVLPIIPGLLFLLLAAIVAAPHFPWVDARLREHRLGRQLGLADRLRHVGPLGKVQIAALLCVRMLADGLSVLASFVAKLRAAAATRS